MQIYILIRYSSHSITQTSQESQRRISRDASFCCRQEPLSDGKMFLTKQNGKGGNLVDSGTGGFVVLWPIILMGLIYIPILALGIYMSVLFIKLARRGIAALDIYLAEKGRRF
ncbi:hypothetical protein [Paenibacillus sp. NPDC058174]|uniref:hypothetical protein n=1 Tax=Paenibacillus sp. NPDC058174 TaxID=3346366 RepID=UPI0036DA51C1